MLSSLTRPRTVLAAASLALTVAAAPARAAPPLPPLFDSLPLGRPLDALRDRLKSAGAQIVREVRDGQVADLRCRAGDAACRRRFAYVSQVVARHRGALYSIGLTSGLTGNRVYQVAVASEMPRGITREAHRQAIAGKLDSKPAGSGAIAMWRLNDGAQLIVSWTGGRYSAVRRDTGLLRNDRIAIDRLRRR